MGQMSVIKAICVRALPPIDQGTEVLLGMELEDGVIRVLSPETREIIATLSYTDLRTHFKATDAALRERKALIESAPELLRVLTAVDHFFTISPVEGIEDLRELVRETVRKARGES